MRQNYVTRLEMNTHFFIAANTKQTQDHCAVSLQSLFAGCSLKSGFTAVIKVIGVAKE